MNIAFGEKIRHHFSVRVGLDVVEAFCNKNFQLSEEICLIIKLIIFECETKVFTFRLTFAVNLPKSLSSALKVF